MPRAKRQRHNASLARKFLISYLVNRRRSTITEHGRFRSPELYYSDLVAGARAGNTTYRSALKYLSEHLSDPALSSLSYQYGSFSSLLAARKAAATRPSFLPVGRTNGISEWVEWVPWIPRWYEEFPLSPEEPEWLRIA
jgi:hypothetical protein